MLSCAGAETSASQEAAVRPAPVPGHVPVPVRGGRVHPAAPGRSLQGDRGDSALQDADGAVTRTLSQR